MNDKFQYRIEWRSKITNYCGEGLYIFTLEKCQDQCEWLNSQYPDIVHWPGKRPEEE